MQQHRRIKRYKWHLHNNIPLILPPERRCRPHLFFLPGLLLPCCPYLWWRLAVSFSGDTLHWCESMDHRLEHWYAANIRQLRRDTPSYPHAVPPILSMYPLSSGTLSVMQESTSLVLSRLVCIGCIFICKERANVSTGIKKHDKGTAISFLNCLLSVGNWVEDLNERATAGIH